MSPMDEPRFVCVGGGAAYGEILPPRRGGLSVAGRDPRAALRLALG